MILQSMWQKIPQQLDPLAFAIGPLQIHWYALMWLFAFGSVYGLLLWRVRANEGRYSSAFIGDLMSNGLLGALLGGRLGYVLFYNAQYYIAHPLQIISPYDPVTGLWIGISGMSYHGGVIGIIAVLVWTARKHGHRLLDLADFIVPAIGFGYFFGRLGNFIGGELVGRVTEVPWAMDFGDGLLRHPSQLYEAVGEGLLPFAFLWMLRNRSLSPGTLTALYFIIYGVIRFLIEYVREPDAHIGVIFLGLTLGQVLCVGMIVLGGSIIAHKRKT